MYELVKRIRNTDVLKTQKRDCRINYNLYCPLFNYSASMILNTIPEIGEFKISH